MVQTRQLQAYHLDIHYTLALFYYKKEFAVKFSKITNLIFLDDKYRYKVGESEFPVATIDRRKKIIISKDITFAVANHDFTKIEIIPSVIMIYNIPDLINSDFYTEKVHIKLKDPIFQSSLLLQHATKLYYILFNKELANKLILCLYIDGGLNHYYTYTHIQLSYICLFIALSLDYFVAVQTPPQHS